MKSFDFDAVIYDGAVYCVECLPEGIDVDSDDVSPIFADSEWDTAPVCENCGTVHDYMTILEPDENDEPSEPEDGDLTTTDHETFYQDGRLRLERAKTPHGYLASHIAEGLAEWFYYDKTGRRLLGAFGDDHIAAIRAYMDRVQFWPNAWFISDHGNAHRIDLTRKDEK